MTSVSALIVGMGTSWTATSLTPWMTTPFIVEEMIYDVKHKVRYGM
jgi:hypothetical protein